MKLKITHEKNNWKESPAILSRHKKKVSKIKDAAVKITHHKGQKEKKNEKKNKTQGNHGVPSSIPTHVCTVNIGIMRNIVFFKILQTSDKRD